MQIVKYMLTATIAASFVSFSAAQTIGSQQPEGTHAAVQRMKAAHPKAEVWWSGGRVGMVYGNLPIGGFDTSETAQRFVNEYAAVFGVQPDELSFSRTTNIGNGKFEAVWFQQYAHGVRVDEAGLTVLVRSGLVQQVVLANPVIKPTPSAPPPANILSPIQAVQIVRSRIPYARFI
ncbi:MAG: hypothetical protein C4340_06180, partial [Armatimonadota bacterium]